MYSKFYRFHLTRNHRQMHRTVPLYLHLLVSGLHHHFSVQCHHSPLAGVLLESTIIRPQEDRIFLYLGGTMIRSPSFKPHFIPIRKGKDIPDLLQPLPPFLFLIPALFRCRFISSARRPASSFRRLHQPCRNPPHPARGVLQAIYRFPLSFLHMIITPVPVHHHDAPVRQTATAPIHFLLIPCQHTGENIKQGSPDRIHQLGSPSEHGNPVSSDKSHKSRCRSDPPLAWRHTVFRYG